MVAMPSPIPHLGSDHSTIEDLLDALETERRLLDELSRVLRRQREGVSRDDLAMLDESMYSAQRVLLTLQQARRRRRTLLGILGGREDCSLGELEFVLGPSTTPAVRTARDELVSTAQRLQKELDVNRRVIEGAISVGDELIMLCLGKSRPKGGYTPHREAEPSTAAGALVNTKA